ncbi:MAG: exodeoxyribonuclease III [Alphaproteobacteria bacterium CG11_big_fil_rev_8_21_14_0_20_44_7]|nr:MAG: exodeoxyribonuclease III [Alphaproteobacteria bacterium CG11_big_fil_rev_8_21_14_0_20_44_7]
MKIVTWNVNSVKSRLEHLQRYLKESSPDVVLLQELKCINENFPAMEIEDLGYNLAINGQKTYNGVAILSKSPIEDVVTTLPGDDSDEQARYIEAVIGDIRVASVYVPNGQSPDSDKFQYKMQFYDRLRAHIENLLEYNEKMVIGADYNVAPKDIDVYDPSGLRGSVCFHPDEQAKFRSLEYLGLTEAFRTLHPQTQKFSWWDYRAGAFQHGKGMRIDHLLLSPQAADKLVACDIDIEPRTWEKPSDHAPVWCEVG